MRGSHRESLHSLETRDMTTFKVGKVAQEKSNWTAELVSTNSVSSEIFLTTNLITSISVLFISGSKGC